MITATKTYPQIFPDTDSYPLWSDRHSRVPSTWLKKFQAFENSGTNALIHRNRGPSTTTYYSFKENKRKTKGTLGKVSYVEIFRDVKNSKHLGEDGFGKIHPNGEGAVLANV
ncbi:hypothetical protein [Comamonas piscis]